MVVDFRNDPEEVQAAFQNYYKRTDLKGKVDIQRLYTLQNTIDNYKVFNKDEMQAVVKTFVEGNVDGIPSMLRNIVDNYVLPMKTEDKDTFRKNVNRYIRSYGFLSQVMTYIDTDLEEYFIFCKLLYKYLPYTKETLPMEILEQIDLDKLRQQLCFEGALHLDDDDASIEMKAGRDVAPKKPDEILPLANILNIVNEPFREYLNNNDKIIRPIIQEVVQDVEVNQSFAKGNNLEILKGIVYEKLLDKTDEYENIVSDLLDQLENKTDNAESLVRALIDKVFENQRKNMNLVFDAERLIAAIVAEHKDDFQDFAKYIRPMDEQAKYLLQLIVKSSLPKYDGCNDLLKDTLNQVYCSEELDMNDRHRHFNLLLAKYEVFLKKVYYLINGHEVSPVLKDHPKPTYIDALLSLPCLASLKNNPDERYQKFHNYSEMVKSWRDTEAHESAMLTEQELKAATHILVTMYLFVITQNTAVLDEVGALE